MKISNASLPYPVLGRQDDYKCDQPEAWLSINPSSNDRKHIIEYTIKFDNSNTQLIELVRNEKAVLNIELDCVAGFIRECKIVPHTRAVELLKEGEGPLLIELEKDKYSGIISVTGYITALEDIVLKNNGQFHDDYERMDFKVSKGDVLAVFPCAEAIHLELDWEHMYHNAGAPVKIVRDDSKNAVVNTVLEESYIEIHLPANDHDKFKDKFEKNPRMGPIMLMNYARPAIMVALNKIIQEPGISNMWADAIKTRISSEPELAYYKPEDGEWENADLSYWNKDIEKIASILLREGEKKMIQSCLELTMIDSEQNG